VCNKGKPGDPGLAYVFVVYFLHKLFEFADTIFFILRKSFRQVGCPAVFRPFIPAHGGEPSAPPP
jgi:hypothetical protein